MYVSNLYLKRNDKDDLLVQYKATNISCVEWLGCNAALNTTTSSSVGFSLVARILGEVLPVPRLRFVSFFLSNLYVRVGLQWLSELRRLWPRVS